MYLFYILIFIIIVILLVIIKDKKIFLNKIGISGIISGVVLIIIYFLLNILFDTFLSDFNISRISWIILDKFIYIGIFFLVIGLIMMVVSKNIKK